MGLFGFKRGGEKKKKAGKPEPRVADLEKDIHNHQAFLNDDPYLRARGGGAARMFAGNESVRSEASRSGTPVSGSGWMPPAASPGHMVSGADTLDRPAQPWTAVHGAPHQRANSLSDAGEGRPHWEASRLPLDGPERPSTSHGPQSKPWANSHSFKTQGGASSRGSPTPEPIVPSASRPGTNSPTQAATHTAQSPSDNNVSTSSSSAPTETSGTPGQSTPTSEDREATSPPSTVSNPSPTPLSPQETVWPLLGKKSGDDLNGTLSASSSYGDVSQISPHERLAQPGPSRLRQPLSTDDVLPTPTPSHPRLREKGRPDGRPAARETKARDTAKQKDLAIQVPRQRSWSKKIDQLERSWLEEQLSPRWQVAAEGHDHQQHQQPRPPHGPQSAPGFQQPQQQTPQGPRRSDRNYNRHQDPRSWHQHPHPQQHPQQHPHQHPQQRPQQRPHPHQLQQQYNDNSQHWYQDPYPNPYRHQGPSQQQQQPYPRQPLSPPDHSMVDGHMDLQGHHSGMPDPRDRHDGITGNGAYPVMPRADRQARPGQPSPPGPHDGRRIGSGAAEGRSPYRNPPQTLRGTKSMQHLARSAREPWSPGEYHDPRYPQGPVSPPAQSPYYPRGSSMASAQYKSPPFAATSPQYAAPTQRSGAPRTPGRMGQSPRTQMHPAPSSEANGYGPLRSPMESPSNTPSARHADYHPGESLSRRSPAYRPIESSHAQQPPNHPALEVRSPPGPRLERRIYGASPPRVKPAPAHPPLNAAMTHQRHPTGGEGVDTDPKTALVSDVPVAPPTTKAAAPRPGRSPPPEPASDLPESLSQDHLDSLTLNSFPLPSPASQSIPKRNLSPSSDSPSTPASPDGDRHDASAAPVDAAPSAPDTTDPLVEETSELNEEERQRLAKPTAPRLSAVNGGSPPDTPTEDPALEPTFPDQRSSSHTSVSARGSSKQPLTPQRTTHSALGQRQSCSATEPEPPISPLSLPTGDAVPSLTANWPLPFDPEPAVSAELPRTPLSMHFPDSPASTSFTSPASRRRIQLAAPHGGSGSVADEKEVPEPQPSPAKSKSAFTASVYARDIGPGPYAFDYADGALYGSSELLVPGEAPWTEHGRRDSLDHATEARHRRTASTTGATTTATATATAVEAAAAERAVMTPLASPESNYGWDGDVNEGEPLSPESIGLARGPSILKTELSPPGQRRWNIASHHVDRGTLHDRIVSGGIGRGSTDGYEATDMAVVSDNPPILGSCARHTPTRIVDSFGTTFI